MAFCGRCGAKLAALCPACGFANPEGFAFCGKCGARLGPEAAPPSYRSFASPDAYTPKHLAQAEELGMRPFVAHCHLGLGTLYRRTGKSQQAREHLTTAAAMYREMDMPFWLEKAEAEAELGALA